jgi:hypothetical protein
MEVWMVKVGRNGQVQALAVQKIWTQNKQAKTSPA